MFGHLNIFQVPIKESAKSILVTMDEIAKEYDVIVLGTGKLHSVKPRILTTTSTTTITTSNKQITSNNLEEACL